MVHASTAAQHWVQLKGGIPTTQARDMSMQKRENDLVVGTFGRGVFVLDDYSALRELTPQALTEEARLFPLRDAYLFDELGQAAGGVGQRGDRRTRRTARSSPTTSARHARRRRSSC